MKFICSKTALVNGVRTVNKAVTKRSTMSILECILINTTDGEIHLTGTDTELGIETLVDGQVEDRGIVAIEAGIFTDIVSNLPDDGDVIVESDENFVTHITCNKANFNIVGKSGEEYPYLPELNRNDSVIISQMALRDVIRQTIFSIAEGGDDSTNQQSMRGELMEIFGDSIRLSSLDGHRISIRRIQLKDVYDSKKVIVPGKSLNEISKILTGGADDDVEISFNPNHIMFEFENTKVVSRLIEGSFFDVDKMNIKDHETKFKVNKRAFMECINRANLLVKEGDKKPIILDIRDDRVYMMINSTAGNMKEDIEIEKYGKDLMIAFNPKFVLDALKVIEDDEVELYFVNSKAPCFIKNNSETYIYVVLPINFNSIH